MNDKNKRHKCIFCDFWIVSPVIKSSGNSKKGIERHCKIGKRIVSVDSKSCKYFKPADIIYCDLYNQRINIINCLVRRRNPKAFAKAFSACRKCRQFDQDLIHIIEDYYIGNKKILEREPEKNLKGRIIKRRAGHPKKRILKRRKTEQPKQKEIKRRKKNKNRKIKRR